MNLSEDFPITINEDNYKFKQILLNLLLKSLEGSQNGFIKVMASYNYCDNKAFVNFDIENSKFELNKKESVKIH